MPSWTQIGCWLLFVGIFVAAGVGLWVFAEALNFTGALHPGRDAVTLYALALGWAASSMAYTSYQRRRAA